VLDALEGVFGGARRWRELVVADVDQAVHQPLVLVPPLFGAAKVALDGLPLGARPGAVAHEMGPRVSVWQGAHESVACPFGRNVGQHQRQRVARDRIVLRAARLDEGAQVERLRELEPWVGAAGLSAAKRCVFL
jgi:hypothetical protein